ncbi:hypothetical protein HK097_002585 [Rhizophlyctis rosea]|uniref:Uncharacterized protein n=1 Tax=Rhizophlyctis rosea TaxID=64517 RepID=A0AAD5S367_9FUNG|nr:hypothetical protein HK097_002585 [Rhizophlyctis rosea]
MPNYVDVVDSSDEEKEKSGPPPLPALHAVGTLSNDGSIPELQNHYHQIDLKLVERICTVTFATRNLDDDVRFGIASVAGKEEGVRDAFYCLRHIRNSVGDGGGGGMRKVASGLGVVGAGWEFGSSESGAVDGWGSVSGGLFGAVEGWDERDAGWAAGVGEASLGAGDERKVVEVGAELVHKFVGTGAKVFKHVEHKAAVVPNLLPVTNEDDTSRQIALHGHLNGVAQAVMIFDHVMKKHNKKEARDVARQSKFSDPTKRSKGNQWSACCNEEWNQLTWTQNDEVIDMWKETGDPEESISSRLKLCRGNMCSLKDDTLVDDAVITAYLQLIAQRTSTNSPSVYIADTNLLSDFKRDNYAKVAKYTRKVRCLGYANLLPYLQSNIMTMLPYTEETTS